MDLNGEALRVIRERSGLTQQALADLAGLKNASHLSNIEAGRRRPSPEVAKALADALKVPLVAILGMPAGAA
jgi:transcriptional regulator with XRE-family HTH domain